MLQRRIGCCRATAPPSWLNYAEVGIVRQCAGRFGGEDIDLALCRCRLGAELGQLSDTLACICVRLLQQLLRADAGDDQFVLTRLLQSISMERGLGAGHCRVGGGDIGIEKRSLRFQVRQASDGDDRSGRRRGVPANDIRNGARTKGGASAGSNRAQAHA